MSNPPTIIAIKQLFISSQTRILAQSLEPSRSWRTANDNAGDHALPPKAVTDALVGLNHRIQDTEWRAHAPQATRHVAEQIDRLYWNAAERLVRRDNGDNGDDDDIVQSGALLLGADFVDPQVIASLPPEWESEQDARQYPTEAKRYAKLAEQLQALDARKRGCEACVLRLRRMRQLLMPFEVDDEGKGEIERELNRMRILLARVGGRVRQLREGEEGDGESGEGATAPAVEDVDVEQRRKVENLLANLIPEFGSGYHRSQHQ